MGFKIKSNGAFEQLQKRLQSTKEKKLEVGFFDPEKATIAAYLEYGWVQRITPKQVGFFKHNYNIGLKAGNSLFMPPRPFMRGTFEAQQKEWTDLAHKIFNKTFDIEKTLGFLGVRIQEDIQQTILAGGTGKEQFAPRSPLTMAMIESSLTKGKHKTDGTPNSSQTTKPLYRTGSLMASVTYKIS